MDLGLANKTVVITGGGAGLGEAIGSGFAKEGANVVVFDITRPKTTGSAGFLHITGDVTSVQDIERALGLAVEKFEGVDILVNNAGIWPNASFVEMTAEEWERTIRVNLTGHFLFTQRFVRYLLAEKRPGQIVNIVSPVAFQGTSGGHSHYAAAKAGLVSLTQSLARELSGSNIRVVAVAPGLMRTQMTNATLSERGDQYYVSRIPMGRFGEPQEIADIVVFMASDRASYVTGATIDVTGGMLMR